MSSASASRSGLRGISQCVQFREPGRQMKGARSKRQVFKKEVSFLPLAPCRETLFLIPLRFERRAVRSRGVALAAALAIVVICMVLLGFGFRTVVFHKSWALVEKRSFQAQLAAESGIDYAKARLTGSARPESVLSLNGLVRTINERQSFQLELNFRYGYIWVRSTGICGGRRHVAEALLGSRPYPESRTALTVAESRFELYASGDTHIRGDIAVPDGRVISRAMRQLPAAPNPLVEGRIFKAEAANIPGITPLILESARRVLLAADTMQAGIAKVPARSDWVLQGQTLKFDRDLELPVWLRKIEGPGTILVRGNVAIPQDLAIAEDAWIVASGDILAGGSLDLGATLIAGGTLALEGPAEGHGVLLARESLTLSKNVRLGWPSQAGLIKVPEMGRTGINFIKIEGGSFLGTLFVWDAQPWQMPLIKIESGSQVAGYIFSCGKLELNAPFMGHIFTHSLQASEGAQTFDNWLKNIRIDRAAESLDWAMPPGFGAQVAVLAWNRR